MKKHKLSIKRVIKYHNIFVVEILYILISLIYMASYLFANKINAGDMFFNYLRIKEVGIDLLHLKIPGYNLYTGAILSGATNIFYPYLLFIPLSIFSLLLNITEFITLLIFIGMFCGLNIANYSLKYFHKPKIQRFIFSILYCLSTVILVPIYSLGDISEFYGMLLAPLVIAGWYQWIINKKWKLLSIAMTIEIYTHIMTVACLVIVLIILSLIYIDKISREKIISLSKAIIVTIISTIFYWLPLITLFLCNKLYLPSLTLPKYPLILNRLTLYFVPQLENIYSFLDVVAFALCLIFWKYLTRISRNFFIICCLIYIINIYPVEQFLVRHTIFSNFQSLSRFSFIAQFFLMFIFVNILFKLIPHIVSHKHVTLIIRILLLWISVVLIYTTLFNIGMNYSRKISYLPYKQNYTLNDYKKYIGNIRMIPDTQSFSNLNNHNMPIIYPDYYPALLSKNYHQFRIFKYVPKFGEYTSNNVLKYKSKDNKYHQMMATTYNGQKYSIKDNNKNVQFKSKKHMLYVKMHRGLNKIRINIPVMWYRWLALIISLIGIVLLIVIN